MRGSIQSSPAWVIFATALPCVSLGWNSDHRLDRPVSGVVHMKPSSATLSV